MLAPFGVEQGKTLTSACPGQGQTDSRTTTHSKFSWFPKLPDSNSQRGPWVTDVPPDAGRHPLRYQSELETGSLVPNFCHGSAVWLKGPKAKCQRGHVITWLYKIYIRQVKLTQTIYPSMRSHVPVTLSITWLWVKIRHHMCAHLSLLRMWGCHTWSTPKSHRFSPFPPQNKQHLNPFCSTPSWDQPKRSAAQQESPCVPPRSLATTIPNIWSWRRWDWKNMGESNAETKPPIKWATFPIAIGKIISNHIFFWGTSFCQTKPYIHAMIQKGV